jgi:hypothetical protein
MKGNTGKAAAWLPFLRSSRMSPQIPIRIAPAVTLLSLAFLVATEFAGAQTGSRAYPQESSQMSVPRVSPQEMTPDDRASAQSWQPAIASSAQFFGYTVDPSYSYREIACPVAPHHLLLAYEATSPNGSASRFTAVVRRGAEEETSGGHPVAQIIPILHFGLVPFIPAIANPLSIEVFNAAISPAPSATEVLSANQAGNQPLLVRALCYLAMVGEEPAALSSPPSSQATIHAPIPTLVFQNKGRIRQQISIRSSQSSYQVWALTFQSGGNLLTATRQEHPIDRTPLVLNAANSGSPAVSTGMTASGAHLSPQPPIPVAAAPVAPAEPTAPRVEPPTSPAPGTAEAAAVPTPPTPPANLPAARVSTLTATPANAAKVEPAPPSLPAETEAPITQPVTTRVFTPAASTVEPVAPAAMATPPPSHASVSAPTPPEPVAGSTPQPPMTPAAPAPVAISAPPAPSAVFVATPPVVKPSPPLPVGRFIQNLPQPPSRFIPNSALKTPPHLSQ